MVLRGQAVLDGAFNPNDKWRALTSKTFLSRIRAAIYLEQVDDFFAYSHREERVQALAEESDDSDGSAKLRHIDSDDDDDMLAFLLAPPAEEPPAHSPPALHSDKGVRAQEITRIKEPELEDASARQAREERQKAAHAAQVLSEDACLSCRVACSV